MGTQISWVAQVLGRIMAPIIRILARVSGEHLVRIMQWVEAVMGIQYGSYQLINNTGFQDQYGVYNNLNNNSSGQRFGTYNRLNGSDSFGIGSKYATYNEIAITGDAYVWIVYCFKWNRCRKQNRLFCRFIGCYRGRILGFTPMYPSLMVMLLISTGIC